MKGFSVDYWKIFQTFFAGWCECFWENNGWEFPSRILDGVFLPSFEGNFQLAFPPSEMPIQDKESGEMSFAKILAFPCV